MPQETLKRSERKRETRARLIQCAYRLFVDRGITRTRTVDIARSAGIAHGTVFVHFPTREALILAVVEEYGIRSVARLRELALKTEPSVREVLGVHVRCVQEQEGFYAHLVLERQLLPAGVRTRLIILQSAVAFYFGKAMKREMANGLVREAPIGLLFNSWLGLLHQYVCNRDLFSNNGPVLAKRGQLLIDHYMSLVSV